MFAMLNRPGIGSLWVNSDYVSCVEPGSSPNVTRVHIPIPSMPPEGVLVSGAVDTIVGRLEDAMRRSSSSNG